MKTTHAFILGAVTTAVFGFVGGVAVSAIVYFALKKA